MTETRKRELIEQDSHGLRFCFVVTEDFDTHCGVYGHPIENYDVADRLADEYRQAGYPGAHVRELRIEAFDLIASSRPVATHDLAAV